MRDRLIELLRKIPYGVSVGAKFERYFCELVADHLIANGVIVPPCKVGDTVYYIPSGNHIIECIVAQIVIEPLAEIGMSFLCYGGVRFDMRDWGKTVFRTREEAERAFNGGVV